MEFEDSDSDTGHGEVMEKVQTDDEESVEETDDTELKHCSVVLDRLNDTSRKSAKPASRIPTFHKRSAAASAELPFSKKDPPASAVQPADKPASADSSKSKLADVWEKTPPQPLARTPKVSSEALAVPSGEEQTTAMAALKGWSETLPLGLMVSPRPALRPGEGLFQEENKSQYAEIDSAAGRLPCVDPPPEESPQRPYIAAKINIALKLSKHRTCLPDVSQTEAIVDEKPPWETEDPNAAESKDVRSSSDVDSEDDEASDDQASDDPPLDDSGSAKDHDEARASEMDSEDVAKDKAEIDEESSASPPVAEQPAEVPSTKSTKKSQCGSCALYLLLPATLLLLGMHAWRFGLPLSVSQLAAHLQLHWLEGVGPVMEQCSRDCRVHLVESIPAGLYPSSPTPQQSTEASWLRLLDKANSSVSIAAFYMSLRSNHSDFADTQGRKVFEQLKQLPSKRVKLKIAVNGPQTATQDTSELAAAGAKIREVDLKSISGGIVHTKMLVIDHKHFYLGSANMDWRSLSQVKEVGVVVEDCSCLAQDAARIFEMYWSLNGSLPPYWPARFTALSSSRQPLQLNFNGVAAQVYLSSSPPQISARGRSDDLAAILSVIDDAQEFIFISVMDYLPLAEFAKPLRFWPAIDSALRAAACTRGVKIRLLVSCWQHSPAAMFTFLQSLLVLNRPPMKCDIEVKIFTVPSTIEQMKIPYARVNHAKYMVTDRVLYIGTSNWSETYFTETAGVGLVVNQTDSEVKPGQRTLQSQAEELFERDWRSHYSSSVSVADLRVCPRMPH
ncbi:5'-3' exonuclease PLD3 isoform X2 [Vanacampus margaritifer]